jgi:serine/threonine protein kinase
MAAVLDCPDPAGWRALFAGELPPEQRESYEHHLESCPACQERLDREELGEEALRGMVRRTGDVAALTADPTLIEFLGRLREGQPAGRPASQEPLDLHFLQPAGRPGLLGTLGGYEVEGVIGQGGMGSVLKAFDPALHRTVAIKVLAAALAGSATARRRFTREAQAAAAVCHDHVITVYGVHEVNGLPYLVMQYVAGESLQERLDRTGPLEVAEVVRIGLQTAQGLAAAHAHGLIHRDIKPANLLLENGLARVKITDFGLARPVDDVGLTRAGVVAGTPEYMAPEQARGEQIDHCADLFSLGSVLYACCTGRSPFRDETPLAVLRRVSDEAPPPVRSMNPDLPAWLEAFIARLLAKDPGQRFQSAAEVATLLEGYLTHLRQPATVPAPDLPPAAHGSSDPAAAWPLTRTRARLPRRLRLAALVPLAVLGLGLVAWGLAGQGAAPPAPAPGRQHLVYDFRKQIDDLPGLAPFGPDAETVMRTDAEGLRITLPADRPDCNNVGVELATRIHGDFDIDLGYELLAIGEPIPVGGAGVQMRLLFDPSDPSSPMESVMRLRSPFQGQPAPLYGRVGHDGDIFAGIRISIMANGINETGYDQAVRVRAQGMKGRLRLTRTGTCLDYLAADDGQPNFLLRSEEVGAADAQTLRLFGFSGWGPVAVDVRLTDLVLDADALPDLAPGRMNVGEVLPGRLNWSKAWLSAALVVGLLLSLPLGVGLCLWARRRRAAATVPAPPGVAARPGSFPCPGCGTTLRARADLAGKRVKCPRCARAVLVPVTGAGKTDLHVQEGPG